MKMRIDRKNRDRRGGHESAPLPGSRINYPTAEIRKQFKRMGTKLLRRQHGEAMALGLEEMRLDATMALSEAMDYDDDYWSGYVDDERDYDLHLDDDASIFDHDDDYGYYHPNDCDLLDVMDREQRYHENGIESDLEFRYVTQSDMGKSLGELLREYAATRGL